MFSRALGEFAADELSIGSVLGWIHHQHHLRVARKVRLFGVGVLDHDGRLRRKRRSVPANVVDIFVCGHSPKARSFGFLMPKDRVMFPKPVILVMRVTAFETFR